jgi:sterol desaturase/sphingolipid hydroxylase (fatty acid hydroxylase superfamily)
MEFYLSFTELFSKFPNTIILVFVPIFIFTILAEALVIQARHGSYSWKNTGVSTLVAVGHVLAQAATHGIIFGIIAAGVYAVRLTTIPVSFSHPVSLFVLFILTDLAFYVEHRCSHRIRLMWASHSVHHSTERMTAAAAFRLSWTPILSGIVLFYLPIVWIGYDPIWVFGMASAGLTYQFFIHTELVPRIGWLDWVLNTPSAHRVHHASNPEYVDKNFGGVLLIWDHLFGTYQAERPDINIRYGLIHPRSSDVNPIVIAYEDFWRVIKEMWNAPGWSARLRGLFGPP